MTDDDVWQDVLDALPNTQKHEESFEDFPDGTPLDGLQSSNGEGSVFTIAVDYQDGDGSNADIEVDSGTVFGVSAVDGNRLLKFNINPRANAETRIDVDFTIPVAGFAINIGDFHDGGRDGENLVEIRFDGELVWRSQAQLGTMTPGPVTNQVSGEVVTAGNGQYTFLGYYDPFNPVSNIELFFDDDITAPTGQEGDNPSGDRFVLDYFSTIYTVPFPFMELTKVADDTTERKVGDVITYTYTVENTGNINIEDVTIDDQHTSAAGTSTLPVSGETGLASNSAASTDATANDGTWDVLAPGDSLTFTSSYTVTYDDLVDGADITNVATATGSSSEGAAPPATANESVTLETAAPSLSITKEADTDTQVTAGDTITYTYTVTNDGNVNVNDIAINDVHNGSDPAPSPADETLLTDAAPSGDSTDSTADDGNWDVLAPGDSVTFTGTYVVSATDAANL